MQNNDIYNLKRFILEQERPGVGYEAALAEILGL